MVCEHEYINNGPLNYLIRYATALKFLKSSQILENLFENIMAAKRVSPADLVTKFRALFAKNTRFSKKSPLNSKKGKKPLYRVMKYCMTKSQSDGLQLKESKCKEFRVDFSKPCRSFQPILINNKSIDVVPSVKLLGLIISEDLKWNQHVMDICKKVSSRLSVLPEEIKTC